MKNLLKVIDDSKTLQILLEKFLIALLIMLATYCINRNLEAFKTRNTIAEVSISKFINSTNEPMTEFYPHRFLNLPFESRIIQKPKNLLLFGF